MSDANSPLTTGHFVAAAEDTRVAAPATTLAHDDKHFVDWLTRVSLLMLVVGQAAAGRTESDIWGHLAIGLDMLRERRFFWVDPYSFTRDAFLQKRRSDIRDSNEPDESK